MKKACIYARVSSISDRQNPDRQVADLTTYALSNRHELKKVFTEKVSGGKKNADRPVLSECLDYCINNGIDVLLLSELSRIGRDVWEIQENMKRCKDNGLNVYFQKENFTLLDSDGKPSIITPVVIAVLGTCAQIERDNISFRLSSGYRQHISKGGAVGRKVGYRKPKETKAKEYANVLKMLEKNVPLRLIAESCHVGVSTVQRLKKEFKM